MLCVCVFPTSQVTQFVYTVGKFLSERKHRGGNGVILVHCTHGFNRTGAMLVHYMQRARPWPKLNEHLAEFATCRPPGIYKPEYVKELFDEYLERRFRTTVDPGIPEWKRGAAKTDAPPLSDAEVPADDLFNPNTNVDYARTRATSRAPRPGTARGFGFDSTVDGAGLGRGGPATTADGNRDGTPMHHDDVLGEEIYEEQANEIRTVVLQLCGQDGSARFPGSQPVSLARDNMDQIAKQEYHVTWKADGTRYMLLLMIDGCYLVDRKFSIRRVQMRFPAPLKTHGVTVHHATLLDGEMVVDDVTDPTAVTAAAGGGGGGAPVQLRQRRRFLAYDLMALLGTNLMDRPFVDRISLINSHVVHPRNLFLQDAGKSGSYNFSKEPFSIRQKDFFPLSGTESTIRNFIPKLTHECDGLIFQPSRTRYVTGTMDTLLKWKFTHLNSVDFLFKLAWVPGSAPAPKLFVGGDRGELVPVDEPSGDFTLGGVEDPDVAPDGTRLSDLDGQIVECTWDKEGGRGDGGEGGGGAWRYLRVRTDKDTPNFVTVYRHTLQSILDDITSEDIIDYVGGVLQQQRPQQQQQQQQPQQHKV